MAEVVELKANTDSLFLGMHCWYNRSDVFLSFCMNLVEVLFCFDLFLFFKRLHVTLGNLVREWCKIHTAE